MSNSEDEEVAEIRVSADWEAEVEETTAMVIDSDAGMRCYHHHRYLRVQDPCEIRVRDSENKAVLPRPRIGETAEVTRVQSEVL